MAARGLGNPLGNPLGLARKSPASLDPLVVFLDSGSGSYKVPKGYTRARVSVFGGGASGIHYYNNPTDYFYGGGGGGCAITNSVSVSEGVEITYVINPNIANGNGGDTTVKFLGYTLVGGGGKVSPGISLTAAGGVGTGGDKNFRGGDGSGTYGGGAAGPAGNGGSGGTIGDLSAGGPGGGTGGGTGGNGGGGPGCDGAGGPAKPNLRLAIGASAIDRNGGLGGGGGGCMPGGVGNNGIPGSGGSGMVRIELW